MEVPFGVLACPFCGAPETERLDLAGRRFIVFRCLFTPDVDPAWDDDAVAQHLTATYAGRGDAFFRGTCDRLHLYVTKGAGARDLLAPPRPPTGASGEPAGP